LAHRNSLVPSTRYLRSSSCQQLKQVMILMCSSLRILLSFLFAVAATSGDVRMGTLSLAALENSRLTFLAEQQHHANRMVLGSDFLSGPFPRHLQEGGNYSLDPEDICAAYQRSGLFSCKCDRYDKYDVIIDCNFYDLQCDSMNITCIAMNFTIVLASPGINQRMTTCSDFVNADPPQQTCIEIKPDTPGLYNATVKCGGALNGQGCQSCAQCTDNENTTITLDCSNVVSGKVSTCQPVSENGATSAALFPAGGGEPTSAAPLRLLNVDSAGLSSSLLMSVGLSVLFTLFC
jgi:hypothetical protein